MVEYMREKKILSNKHNSDHYYYIMEGESVKG